MLLTNEDIRKVIEETIKFDEQLRDPKFMQKVKREIEEIRNMDLEQYFKGAETE